MLAARMGMPVRRFVAASNANDVVPEFLITGDYLPRASVRTVANAMDVGAPSNYERMMWLYGSIGALRREVVGFSASDQEILAAIREIEDKYGYISDPHSAIGYLAAKHYDRGSHRPLARNPRRPPVQDGVRARLQNDGRQRR